MAKPISTERFNKILTKTLLITSSQDKVRKNLFDN